MQSRQSFSSLPANLTSLYQQALTRHSSGPVTLLHLAPEETHLISGSDMKTMQWTVLPVGYRQIRETHYRHTPPTPDDIEFAINQIEDEIEKIVPLINSQSRFTSLDEPLQTIALLATQPRLIEMATLTALPFPVAGLTLTREQMEALFNEYALLSMGRPITDQPFALDREFYAKLLIFRELMHHLQFSHIEILSNSLNLK